MHDPPISKPPTDSPTDSEFIEISLVLWLSSSATSGIMWDNQLDFLDNEGY
jgi:hypothetical protein